MALTSFFVEYAKFQTFLCFADTTASQREKFYICYTIVRRDMFTGTKFITAYRIYLLTKGETALSWGYYRVNLIDELHWSTFTTRAHRTLLQTDITRVNSPSPREESLNCALYKSYNSILRLNDQFHRSGLLLSSFSMYAFSLFSPFERFPFRPVFNSHLNRYYCFSINLHLGRHARFKSVSPHFHLDIFI